MKWSSSWTFFTISFCYFYRIWTKLWVKITHMISRIFCKISNFRCVLNVSYRRYSRRRNTFAMWWFEVIWITWLWSRKTLTNKAIKFTTLVSKFFLVIAISRRAVFQVSIRQSSLICLAAFYTISSFLWRAGDKSCRRTVRFRFSETLRI